MLSKNIRPWVCAVPQPGWGGTTLAGYVESIEMRPELENAGEDECRQVLEALVERGIAQEVKTAKDEPERWELTDSGHDDLVALIDPDETATAESVLLELQPGVGLSSATTEGEA